VGTEEKWVSQEVPIVRATDPDAAQGLEEFRGNGAEPDPEPEDEQGLIARAVDWLQLGLISAGQQSKFVRTRLVNANKMWNGVVQPAVEFLEPYAIGVADFVAGTVYQWIDTNVDAAKPVARTLIPSSGFWSWHERIEEGLEETAPTTDAFQYGRTLGDTLSLVQGLAEIGVGASTAVGGSLASCIAGLFSGPGVAAACPGGSAASIVAGVAVVAHGSAVAYESIEGLGGHLSRMKSESSSAEEPGEPPIDPESYDYSEPPGPGWEWKGDGKPGSREGSWFNEETREYIRADFHHDGDISPHYDWRAPDGTEFRLYLDNTLEPKP
jgi:hypothetical protein